MPTWRLLLEYDGTAYVGWQRQPRGTSIQALVEQALREVLGGEAVDVHASGRTDAGVHALGQVASFRAATERTDRAVRMGLNSLLPRDVACRSAWRVAGRVGPAAEPETPCPPYIPTPLPTTTSCTCAWFAASGPSPSRRRR